LYNRPKWPQYQGLRYLGTKSHPTNNKKIIKRNNKKIKRLVQEMYCWKVGKIASPWPLLKDG
jgi:hypothetical protein